MDNVAVRMDNVAVRKDNVAVRERDVAGEGALDNALRAAPAAQVHLLLSAGADPRVEWGAQAARAAPGAASFGGGPFTSAGTDVFVAKFDSNGNHVWSKRFGDADVQIPNGVAVDSAGNVVITGDVNGTTDFGGGPLTSAAGSDIFVAKFDSSGNNLWSGNFGQPPFNHSAATAIDSAGNVVITGFFQNSVDFGNGPHVSAGLRDIFLAKLAP